MCFQDHMHAPHCCQHYSPKSSLWSSYIYVNHILKKKKNHPEALFQKALPHHSINNPAQSPGFYGLTYLPTPPLHTHQPPRGGVGSETSKASRPLGSICYRSCNWPEDCEMNHMDGPIWISESPSLGPSVKKIKKDTLHSLMQVPRTTEAGLSINLPAENTGRQGLTDNETPEKRNGKGCSKCGATGHAMLLPSWTHQYCEQINAYSELSSWQFCVKRVLTQTTPLLWKFNSILLPTEKKKNPELLRTTLKFLNQRGYLRFPALILLFQS